MPAVSLSININYFRTGSSSTTLDVPTPSQQFAKHEFNLQPLHRALNRHSLPLNWKSVNVICWALSHCLFQNYWIRIIFNDGATDILLVSLKVASILCLRLHIIGTFTLLLLSVKPGFVHRCENNSNQDIEARTACSEQANNSRLFWQSQSLI